MPLNSTPPADDSTVRRTILVTAGPTREYFDSVRFISNPSTGKQGYAIAEVAARRGYDVVLVSGPVQITAPTNVRAIQVTSAAEMAAACKAAFPRCCAAIMTAAVCDYRPPERLPHKLAKRQDTFTIALQPTEDIAATLGRIKDDRILIGFAMNDHEAEYHAERKLAAKNCDHIVLNGLANVGADTVSVRVLSRNGGWQPPFTGTKHDVAERVVDLVERT